MLDIKWIREQPEALDAGLKARGQEPLSAKLIALDADRREMQTKLQTLQQERNQLAKEIGKLKSQGQAAEKEQARAREINEQMAAFEASLAEDTLSDLLSRIPNIPAADVPTGKDEHDNKEVRKVGTPRQFSFTPKQHFELGEKLGLLDFEQTAKISGSRFATLFGSLARMERALAAFMLDMHTNEFGYTEVSPPLMVRDVAMFGVGQLPKFAEESFQTTSDYRLIPTAEVPITNLVADRIIDEKELPLKFTAFTPCFRSEAGAAGKDTRGLVRMHQFSKVELVAIATPETSVQLHEALTSHAEEVLKRLGLPYRVVALCTGDMGFSSEKTYDLEVWLPGQNTYREISSCSRFGAFQARRMKARYKSTTTGKNDFVHTINGSGLAVGRTMVAVLENYQNEDGSVNVPEALQPYMGGTKKIG